MAVRLEGAELQGRIESLTKWHELFDAAVARGEDYDEAASFADSDGMRIPVVQITTPLPRTPEAVDPWAQAALDEIKEMEWARVKSEALHMLQRA